MSKTIAWVMFTTSVLVFLVAYSIRRLWLKGSFMLVVAMLMFTPSTR